MGEVAELIDVPVREVWPSEPAQFSPWVASHAGHLGKILGLDLELQGVEVSVGPFGADVVFTDAATGDLVVVENWLDVSDHDHLGKLITYAAGLKASVAVLIAREFRPEHRSALLWLNAISTSETAFFGLRISAVRIGDSPPAARFDVVVEPDDWSRQIREAASLTPAQARNVDFWTSFLTEFHAAHPGWSNARVAPKDHWINFPAGRSDANYTAHFSRPPGSTIYALRVALYLGAAGNAASLFAHLKAHQQVIEERFGEPLIWDEVEGRVARIVAAELSPIDPARQDEWPSYRAWAIDALGRLRSACQPSLDTYEGQGLSAPALSAEPEAD